METRSVNSSTAAEVEREQTGPALDAGLAGRWADLDIDARRAVLGRVLESVEIAPTTRQDNRFNPDRVLLEWKV